MICPHCHKNINMPTLDQQEAYRLVHIYGTTHLQAAKMLYISRAAVTQRLQRLRAIRPDLFPQTPKDVTPPKILSYDHANTYAIKAKY